MILARPAAWCASPITWKKWLEAKPGAHAYAGSADSRWIRNDMAARIKSLSENVVPALTKEFGYKNSMAVPRLVKISVTSAWVKQRKTPS
jgi:hypothetical protein